jgi:Icc-related predicted phosphoesterase
MRLILISDTHGHHQALDLPAGDVLVHAGDLSADGSLEQIRQFMQWFAAVGHYRHRVLIAGNHDLAFERAPASSERLVPASVTYLNDSGALLDGALFWGSPVTPAFQNWAFNRQAAELEHHWARIPEGVTVLITHGPPAGLRDGVGVDRLSVGCPLLGQAVQRVQPRLHVFGHIHEGYGETRQDGVHSVNAASCDAAYRLTNPPVVVDLDLTSPRARLNRRQ